MPVIVFKSEILCELEKEINDGNKIILFCHNDRRLLETLCNNMRDKKLTNVTIWHSLYDIQEVPCQKTLSLEQIGEVLEVYRMYDFFDKITVISESEQHGSMLNYVRNGILTKKEMVDAILCKI